MERTTTISIIKDAYDNLMDMSVYQNYILLGGNAIGGINDGSSFPYIYIIYDDLPNDTTQLFLIKEIPGKLNNGVEIYATTKTIPDNLQYLYNAILNYEIPSRNGGKRSKKRKSRKNKKSKRKTNKK